MLKIAKISRTGIVLPLLLIVFFTELAVMELLSPFFAGAHPIIAALVDATMLSLCYAGPLYLVLTGALTETMQADEGRRRQRRLFLWQLLAIIFVAELLVMVMLPLLLPASSSLRPITDALLTTALVAPAICWIVSRQQQNLLVDLQVSPLKLYVLLLGAVFVIDLLEAELLPLVFTGRDTMPYQYYDAFVTTLFTAPFIWWLMVRPLQRAALTERVRHDAIQSQVVDAIVGIDPLGVIISSNIAAEHIFGYDADEIVGQPAAILFCDDLLTPAQLHAFTETGGESKRKAHEVICHHKNGQPITLEISVSRLVLNDTIQFLVIMRDISERKKMELALRASNERFDIAVNGASEGIWDWNILTGEIYFSPRLRELLGYEDGEVRNEFTFVESLIHPDDHGLVMATVTNHLLHRNPYEMEFRVRNKSDQFLWFRARGQAVWDRAGRPVRMAGSISDISSRKAAEEALRKSESRFRQIFEQSEDAIIFFSPGACQIIDVNATTERLFGYSRAELLAGGIDCLAKEEDAQLKVLVCGSAQEGTITLDRWCMQKKDGSDIIVSLRGKLMTLQDVPVICCSFRDITQRIRLEEQAREIQAKLIQANKMTSLGLMVSGVAHEITNPNSFILANAELLEKSWVDALKVLREYAREHGDFLVGGLPFSAMEQHIPEMLSGIREGSQRITGIVGDLKGFVRQDRRAEMRATDVNKSVQAAVEILQNQIGCCTENFQLELGEALPLIEGNNQQLGQVIINLLLNACQALPNMQAGVSLRTGFDAATRQVVVAIHDEGDGIPPELGKRIMEPFFTTRVDAGGTGLGLSISHSIVKEHGGSLEFVSEPGTGTTFFVRLPIPPPRSKEHT